MNKRDAFLRFVGNHRITPEDYSLVKDYYLNSASLEEIQLCDSFLKILVSTLQIAQNKSELHLKVLAKKHGMSVQDALELIQGFQIHSSDNFLLDLERNNINIEDYLKGIYNTCIRLNCSKNKIEELASKLGITYKLLLDLVQIYMKKYLGISKLERIHFVKKIEIYDNFYAFLNDKVCNDFGEILYYIKNIATQEEIIIFNNVVLEMVGKFYSDDKELEVIAKKLEEKYCVSFDCAKKLVKQYVKIMKNKIEFNKYKILCDMFLGDSSYEEISTFILSSKISWEYFRKSYLSFYIKSFIMEDKQEVAYDKILLRIQQYLQFKNKERRILKERLAKEAFDEEIFREAKIAITKIVYGSVYVETFRRRIGEESFYRYLIIVKKYDKPLYDLYLMRRYKKDFLLSDNSVNALMNYINNGIVENGIVRVFNILDYFRIFKLPIDIMIEILLNYDSKIRRVIVSFLIKNKSNMHLLSDIILLDATDLEDSKVREYLILNDLPMFDMVYMLVLNEYRNGVLNLNGNSRN